MEKEEMMDVELLVDIQKDSCGRPDLVNLPLANHSAETNRTFMQLAIRNSEPGSLLVKDPKLKMDPNASLCFDIPCCRKNRREKQLIWVWMHWCSAPMQRLLIRMQMQILNHCCYCELIWRWRSASAGATAAPDAWRDAITLLGCSRAGVGAATTASATATACAHHHHHRHSNLLMRCSGTHRRTGSRCCCTGGTACEVQAAALHLRWRQCRVTACCSGGSCASPPVTVPSL